MSRIRANQITNQSADGAPTVQNGLVISGVTTSTNVSVASSVTATTYYGSGANLTNITSTTINNNADNRVITGSNTSNTLEGESNVVINGGKLGIGVASPAQLIEVHGASNPAVLVQDTTNNCISYMYSQDSVATFGSASNHPVVFNVSNGEKARIDTGGNLLLGTTTAGHVDLDDLTISTSGNTGITIRSGTSSLGVIGFADGTSGNTQYRGVIQYRHSNDAMEFNTADAQRMRILGDGRVLINTSDGAAFSSRKLSVADVSSGGTTAIEIRSATNGSGRLYFTDSTSSSDAGSYAGKVFYDHNTDYMGFYTGGGTNTPGERMKIDAYGRVTTPNQPMCSYHLNSSIQSGNYIIHNTVHTNNGNHYNTGNGRFVCPVAGYYYASIMAMTNNSNTQLDIELHKNGSNPNNILVPYNQSGGIYNQVAGSCIIYCAANDYLQFKLNSGSIYNGRHGNVSFALLA